MYRNRKEVSRVSMLIVLLLLFFSFAISVKAQDEPEYKMEIGAGLGLINYLGDYNGNLFRNMQPMGGIVVKDKLNPRMAWAATLNYGQMKGSATDAGTWYPDDEERPLNFTTKLTDLNIKYEYNFWPFGTGREYHGAKPLTPYISFGCGLAFASSKKSVVAFQVPIGMGVKYKLTNRLNLSAEWLMHVSASDRLDGINDPYGIKSSDLFKNTDCYTTLQFHLTYEFLERCKSCHNDDE